MSSGLQLLHTCPAKSGPGGGARGWQQSRKGCNNVILVISADLMIGNKFQSGPKWRINQPASPLQKPSWEHDKTNLHVVV